jgi:hypothetical protein
MPHVRAIAYECIVHIDGLRRSDISRKLKRITFLIDQCFVHQHHSCSKHFQFGFYDPAYDSAHQRLLREHYDRAFCEHRDELSMSSEPQERIIDMVRDTLPKLRYDTQNADAEFAVWISNPEHVTWLSNYLTEQQYEPTLESARRRVMELDDAAPVEQRVQVGQCCTIC